MAGFAWVTLATNDSYSLGALVLAHSLRRVGSKHDLAVLVTPGVTGAMREKLSSVFSLVQEVNVLDSKDEANLALLARPELGITFTKLHCWRLTQYEKCVFIDADTLVIRNCDELFERDELSAAPDVGWPDCFNSGVFVFKPSQQTFASITAFAAAKGSFDGGDQGLLNQYFSDWSQKDISKHLPFIYNMCSTATYSYLPAFKQFGEDVRIIHFIGITKPWLQYFDTVTGQVQPAPGSNHLQPLLQLWWQIFCENVHPQLSPVMTSSNLATIRHDYNPHPSRSHIPVPYDTNEFSYNNIQPTDPDFSEFNDPWDKYVAESSQTIFSNPHEVSSTDDYNRHDDFTSVQNNNNDNYHHLQTPSLHRIVEQKFESRDDNSNNITKHHDYELSRISDNFQIKKMENNNQTHHEKITDDKNLSRHLEEEENFHSRCETINSSPTREENYQNEDVYREPCYYEQNVCREVIDRHEHDGHHDQERRNDEQKYFPHFRQDDLGDDNSHDKIHEHNHNHEHDYSNAKALLTDHDDVRLNIVETKSSNINFAIDAKKMQKNVEKLTTARLNSDCRVERTTDSLTKQLHSNPVCEKKTCLSFPSEPCSKSKIIETQSESNIAGQLESNDAGIAGALAKLTLGEARSPEQVAFEEHMRKQSWEQGQIDYMGRDSFDNIWKKISETLGVQSSRQPSPPKTVPKPEEIEVKVAAAVVVADEPTAKKSEPAASAESRKIENDEEQDLIVNLESRSIDDDKIITTGSSSLDAALSTTAHAQIDEKPFTRTTIGESMGKNVSDDTIVAPSTTEVDRSISHLLRDIDAEKMEKIDQTETLEAPAAAAMTIDSVESKMASEKNVETEKMQIPETTSSEIISDSPVPIQVAESVLEPEVKESVTENLRPVTEEAISSISVSTGEIVSAPLETTMQAICPSTSTTNDGAILNVISEIGNGIDALRIDVAEEARETINGTEEIRLPIIPPTRQAVSTGIGQQSVSLPAATVPEREISLETQRPIAISPEIVRESAVPIKIEESESSTMRSAEKSADSELSVPTDVETTPESVDMPRETSRDADSSTASEKPSEQTDIRSETQKIGSTSAKIDEKVEEAVMPEKSTPLPVEESKIDEKTTIPIAKVSKSVEADVISVKVEDPATSAPSEIISRESSTETKDPVTCPAKPVTKIGKDIVEIDEKKLKIGIDEAKIVSSSEGSTTKRDSNDKIDNTDLSATAMASEESPTRPARTKELQIPGTPTVTEATPPTSPPIGALESFDAQQPARTTKKVVKKIVKKSTSTEPKSSDVGTSEVEGEVTKKVTKKVVKKIVKKTKPEDAAAAAAVGESSSANEKPKKIVKVVKKTTKQTLETDASVPETPPPGTDEIPVPPKRKLKTVGKSTAAKSDREP